MRVLGLISGTSHDGIDVAVVDFAQRDGALTGRVVHCDSVPYDPALRRQLVQTLPPQPTTMAEVCELDTAIGQAFAAAARDAAAAAGGVDAVCSHGQTVFHWVEGVHARGTLQLGQPAWIAESLGVPVVSDVRIRDITAGGHGAPLVSFLDELLLRDRAGAAAALNLGGIANITVVDGGSVLAHDIGPANALIDAVVREHDLHPAGYDEGGRIARSGSVDVALLRQLLAEEYYTLPAPKSTGKELFHLEYVRRAVAATGRRVPAADLVATLTELTVLTVAGDVRAAGVRYLAVSGGGGHNEAVMAGLRRELPDVRVAPADDLGAPADSKEAILLALIGWCTLHGVPATVPGGTGATAPRVLGSITPGRGPLTLPEPIPTLRSLRLETPDG